MDFHSMIEVWHEFYSVLSQVSATFAGLLFVSLSLRHEVLNHPECVRVKHLAQHTFKAFLYLVVFSLIFMIPKAGLLGTTIPLFLVALYAFVITARGLKIELRDKSKYSVQVSGAIKIYLLSLLTYLMFGVVAVLLFIGVNNALYLVVGLVIWTLALVTTSSWKLLAELNAGNIIPSNK
ncbi:MULTISPECIES: hypothetical protein [Pseudoalteromonas]|uniref:Uncharacterized protein n=1 Tax=Pseudoalteromonas luteoviolacea (strain 2ta16) TaxID=1353533 RepID=V4HTF0_PSEL2|nr:MULTISPECIES: hypothetical protein [Pseudoalteromonas]ESP91204.1 hypothetical protein PL2TA16_01075 [Pseudoalteromonas luteoviolacea 2ta16]KZN31407.1 hypothetical protein N483_06220 [Pseudoalteromonas luteoviolacea NCIMB 1944]MCG7548656.1 hypothetical protein [Pseudoalteromonas sp. Of7M-16]